MSVRDSWLREFPFFRNCDCFYNLGKRPSESHEFQELSETSELCLLPKSCKSLSSLQEEMFQFGGNSYTPTLETSLPRIGS